MNRGDLEKIIIIAEEGSMARAAMRLYVTQPALSKSLTKVEEELGELLFSRRPSGLTLTYAGECFLKKAYQILRLYDEMGNEFSEFNQMKRGVLKIGATERLGAIVFPDILEKFRIRYPNIRIELVEDGGIRLEEKLLMGALDLAVLSLPLKNDHLNYRVFCRDRIWIALPVSHPLNQKAYFKSGEDMPYLALEDLKGEKLILTKRFKKTRAVAERLLTCLEGEYEVFMESYNIETVIRFVAKGMGVSLIPAAYARIYLEPEKIRYFQIEPENQPFWQWALVHNDALDTLTRSSREFYKIVFEENEF